MKRLVVLSAALACSLLGACASRHPKPALQPAQPESVRERVVSIVSHLSSYDKVVGKWGRGRAKSAYQAYFADGKLVYVTETAGGKRAEGYAVNKYYFNDGKLFYYRGQGSAGSPSRAGSSPVQIDIEIAFNRRGQPVRADKEANGRAVELQSGEAAAIVDHARDLRDDATAAR